MTASMSSPRVTRKTGSMNISAPVLINSGGKIIFLAFVGFSDAFMRTKKMKNAITTAMSDVMNAKAITFFRQNSRTTLL